MNALTSPDATSEQGLRYVMVGIWNTAFGYAVFVALEVGLGGAVPYMATLVITQVVATFEAYLLYRYLVFRAHGRFWRDLLRFTVVYTTAFAVNLVLLPVMVSGLGWNVLASQALIVTVTAAATFFAHRSFSFRR